MQRMRLHIRHSLIEATKMKFDIEERGGDNILTNINRNIQIHKHTHTRPH